MSSQQKRMGGLKLTDFGKSPSKSESQPVAQPVASPSPPPVHNAPSLPQVTATQAVEPHTLTDNKQQEKLVTVNIKILESQQDWLADTAKQIRRNNIAPVPPAERVYPQHLIQVAIELLESANVDWQQVRNVDDLREHLKL